MKNNQTTKLVEMKDEDIKSHLVEILKYFDSVCRKNGIKYSLDGGSLIGAIRHGGIIPWDDDIDVNLNRHEYAKFIKAIKKHPNSKFHLFLPGDDGYPYPFPKLVSTDTVLIENGFEEIPGYGVFLDIFVYHNMPNNCIRRMLFWQHIRFLKHGISAQRRIGKVSSFCKKQKLAYHIAKVFRINCLRSYIRCFDQLPDKPSKIVCHNWPGYSRKQEFIDSKDFKKYIDVDFEGIKAMAIANYDSVLTRMYGNYMQLPPKEKQVSNHNFKAYYRKER